MADLIQKALKAKRESKHIEFKQGFNSDLPGEWCEVIKDIVAMANSGGGIIIFGLDNQGAPSDQAVTNQANLDPADIGNKIAKYTGHIDLEFEVRELKKKKKLLIAFFIQGSGIPIIFEKPGTYDIGGGRQKTAFNAGMIYFRHGAKSEPGTSDDIRRVIERQLEFNRKSWLKNVRKIVQAPQGSQIITADSRKSISSSSVLPSIVRAVSDPRATPVLLTRDPDKATGAFVHEQVSDVIFDEINNVIDANRVLSKGQQHFFLGCPIYFRIYAERQHVAQSDNDIILLLRSGVLDFYAPAVYWLLRLPAKISAGIFAEIYLSPRNLQVHYLMRIAILLGKKFSGWLLKKWTDKWKSHPQPPAFYWTFNRMVEQSASMNPILIASRFSPNTKISADGVESHNIKDLLIKPGQAAILLSKGCMRVFQGHNSLRSIVRNLDFITYGREVSLKLPELGELIIKAIGDRKPGDFIETDEDE